MTTKSCCAVAIAGAFASMILFSVGNIARAADTKSITVLTWGTTWQTAIQPASEMFEKATGIKVNVVTQSSSGEGLVKLQAMKDKPTIDVWFTTSSVAERAAEDQKLFAPLPSKEMKNWGDVIPGATNADYVAAYYYPLSIIYRPDMVSTPITSWQQLWDQKYKNKLGIPNMSMFQGRMLLVAALINGGSETNVDPGFDALKRLKPNVVMFYGSDAQARQALAQGEIAVLVAPPSQAKRMTDQGIKVSVISPQPTPMMYDVMMLVRSGNEPLAAKFIDFMIGQDAQHLISERLNMGPVNRNVPPAESLKAALPKSGDGVTFSEQKLNLNIGPWTERFNKEVAQ
jgi:putative spermidine/putrescine transport system substrate-binding protein